MTVGCVIRTSPLRNKVSHAVSADTASARMATISANNETVELNKSVIRAVFLGCLAAVLHEVLHLCRLHLNSEARNGGVPE